MSIKTLNIIELCDGDILGVTAFHESGIDKAKEVFRKLVYEHNEPNGMTFTEDELDGMFHGRGYNDTCGYEVVLITSSLWGGESARDTVKLAMKDLARI